MLHHIHVIISQVLVSVLKSSVCSLGDAVFTSYKVLCQSQGLTGASDPSNSFSATSIATGRLAVLLKPEWGSCLCPILH